MIWSGQTMISAMSEEIENMIYWELSPVQSSDHLWWMTGDKQHFSILCPNDNYTLSLCPVAGGEEGDYTPLATLTLIIFPSATDIIIPGPRLNNCRVGIGERKQRVSFLQSPPSQTEPLRSFPSGNGMSCVWSLAQGNMYFTKFSLWELTGRRWVGEDTHRVSLFICLCMPSLRSSIFSAI